MRRQGSGYYDGWYSVPAGHVEAGELPVAGLVREVSEELGIDLDPKNIRPVHTMYRTKQDETGDRLDLFFTTSTWQGEIKNAEPQKCNDIAWFPLDALPENLMHHVRGALQNFQKGISYSELDLAHITTNPTKDLKATYNKIAEDWFRDHKEDTWWQAGVDAFVSFLKPGGMVLDIGCGSGSKSQYLLNKGFKVLGADLSEMMVEIARREVPGASFQVADIKDLGGMAQQFEGILAQAVLLHIPKAQVRSVIEGLRGKLRDGGFLYIAVKEKRADGPEEEVVLEEDYGYKYERFFSYFTLRELKKYLVDAGFAISFEQVVSVGSTNWIQIAGKK